MPAPRPVFSKPGTTVATRVSCSTLHGDSWLVAIPGHARPRFELSKNIVDLPNADRICADQMRNLGSLGFRWLFRYATWVRQTTLTG